MRISKQIESKLSALPDSPGVYMLRDERGRIVYIGKATSLRNRVRSYFRKSTFQKALPKKRGLMRTIADLDYIELKTEPEAAVMEGRLIKEHRPRYNTLFKDDKRFCLLRVRLSDPFPRFEKRRIEKDDGAIYFGPYTSTRVANAAREFVERRFGIRRCRAVRPNAESYKHCHNDRIRTCSAPCTGKLTREDYCRRVEVAADFLAGKRPEFLKEVRSQMKLAAQEHDFEKAASLRDMLFLLQKAVKDRARVRKSVSLKKSEAKVGLRELEEILRLPALPQVMECFDISNISGTHAVASMVAFVDGIPRPQRYRRFRIKTVHSADDPAMMAEAVKRRYSRLLKEKKTPPDLVIVDGGITQLRAAWQVLDGLKTIPVIGLAKQREEIVWDLENKQPPIRLEPESLALRVLRNIRDEAHRFAISYHRQLRSRRIRNSILDDIPMIGEKKKALLLSHFSSVARLKKSSAEEIAKVPGIGIRTARLIKRNLV